MILSPGFIDPQATSARLGREDEERSRTAPPAAAAAGGYCANPAIPNTDPVSTTKRGFAALRPRAAERPDTSPSAFRWLRSY